MFLNGEITTAVASVELDEFNFEQRKPLSALWITILSEGEFSFSNCLEKQSVSTRVGESMELTKEFTHQISSDSLGLISTIYYPEIRGFQPMTHKNLAGLVLFIYI